MSISDKLEYLQATKTDIKNAIISKGQSVSSSDTFRSYGDKIRAITPNLGTKNITENGTYNASSDSKDGYSQVTVNVQGGGGTLIAKTITQNGTYNASTDGADGYSTVRANIAVALNADTNGDGQPDLNIDTNGDGKPDVNIDTNGDGKPDVNIDTNGDGVPDINIDTNGDGVPDLNIDTDGDGIADTNIDTDGDGIPDTNLIPTPGGGGGIVIDINSKWHKINYSLEPAIADGSAGRLSQYNNPYMFKYQDTLYAWIRGYFFKVSKTGLEYDDSIPQIPSNRMSSNYPQSTEHAGNFRPIFFECPSSFSRIQDGVSTGDLMCISCATYVPSSTEISQIQPAYSLVLHEGEWVPYRNNVFTADTTFADWRICYRNNTLYFKDGLYRISDISGSKNIYRLYKPGSKWKFNSSLPANSNDNDRYNCVVCGNYMFIFAYIDGVNYILTSSDCETWTKVRADEYIKIGIQSLDEAYDTPLGAINVAGWKFMSPNDETIVGIMCPGYIIMNMILFKINPSNGGIKSATFMPVIPSTSFKIGGRGASYYGGGYDAYCEADSNGKLTIYVITPTIMMYYN